VRLGGRAEGGGGSAVASGRRDGGDGDGVVLAEADGASSGRWLERRFACKEAALSAFYEAEGEAARRGEGARLALRVPGVPPAALLPPEATPSGVSAPPARSPAPPGAEGADVTWEALPSRAPLAV
jgi:hypothetical protein